MSNPKELRKQLRNVVQEQLPELLKTEVIEAIDKKLTEDENNRLTKVEDFVKTELKKMNDRAKEIHGFMIREVAVKISNQMHNATITMLAWQELVQVKLSKADEYLGLLVDANPGEERTALRAQLSELFGNTEEFNKELDNLKLEVNAKLEAEAVAKQQESLKQEQTAQQIEEPPVSSEPAQSPESSSESIQVQT